MRARQVERKPQVLPNNRVVAGFQTSPKTPRPFPDMDESFCSLRFNHFDAGCYSGRGSCLCSRTETRDFSGAKTEYNRFVQA